MNMKKILLASKQGFTLIELLVVITIISVLTIITVSQFQTAKKKANDVARKGDLNALTKALQLYYADYGKFPPVDKIIWGGTFIDQNYVYMKVVPKENTYTSTNPYCYSVDASFKKYAIFAKLENANDIQCTGSYTCGEKTGYCYAVVSPNTSLDASGTLQ